MVDASEWLPAKKVLEILTADGRSPAEVEAMLSSYLRNGDLHAHAERTWKSDERFTTQAWKSCPDDAVGGPIPRAYWRLEKAAVEDRSQWRFVTNKFLATTRLKPRRRIMMRGVSFSVTDLQKLQPKVFLPTQAKRKRGPNADIGKRDAVWLALLDVLFDSAPRATPWKTINDLSDEMNLKREKANTVFGEKATDEVARKAFNLLKQRDAVGFVAGGKPPSA